MDPLSLHGALPTRAQGTTTNSPATGPTPQLDAAAQVRAESMMQMFMTTVQMSMSTALDGLFTEGEDGAEGAEGAEGGGEGGDEFSGLDQASSGAEFGSDLAGAGAGDEAALAQQLLASLMAQANPAATAGVTKSASVASHGSAKQNAAQVADVARGLGVDPTTAVAMMLVESGGNAGAVGDGGTSFGLFQLHQGGMLTAAGLSPEQAFDPRTNAQVALKSFAHERDKGPNRTPGTIAAASQRPADPAGYARKVDAAMEQARALLG